MLVLSACMLVACKKELNIMPTDRQVDGNVIIDAKSAATVLNGVYYRFANAGTDNNGVPSIKWWQVSEILPSQICGTLENKNVDDVNGVTFTASSTVSLQKWSYGYNLVNAANGFLKNIEQVSGIVDNTKKQMQAEAKFLRAFGNADLLFHYGQYRDINSKYGVIIRNNFVSSDQINQARSTVKESYDAILADLDVAIAGLPTRNTQLSYANVWAAKLLKARVLMNRGIGSDYATVISLTDDIIKNSKFTLEGLTRDLFLVKGFQSSEVMMAVQPFPTETIKFLWYQSYVQYIASPAMLTLLKDDPRADWIFTPVVKYGDTYNMITKYYSGSVTTISATPLCGNSYAFRLTEAYLLQAEAITLSGGDLQQAKNLLKEVKGHAGVTVFTDVDGASSTAALQKLIVEENMRNFVAENGLDWLALRRLPFEEIKKFRPAIKSADFLILPVPASEFVNNDKMEQNPGYGKN